MALLETPSRIWRRIEADEQNDMPSLPDVPAFEDSNDVNATTTSEESHHSAFRPTSPLQSTPAPLSAQTTIRLQSSTSSSTRFAQSIASRASRSGSTFSSSTGSLSRRSRPSISSLKSEASFDEISAISFHSQPNVAGVDGAGVDVAEGGLDDDMDMSLAEALRPTNRSGSPFPLEGMPGSGHSKYNYSVSLRSEPKVCTVLRLFKAFMNAIVTDEPLRQDAKCLLSKAHTSHAYSLPHTDAFPVVIFLEFHPSFQRAAWTGATEQNTIAYPSSRGF